MLCLPYAGYFLEGLGSFLGFEIIIGFKVLPCQTSLLCIVGELAGGVCVAVGVSDRCHGSCDL